MDPLEDVLADEVMGKVWKGSCLMVGRIKDLSSSFFVMNCMNNFIMLLSDMSGS